MSLKQTGFLAFIFRKTVLSFAIRLLGVGLLFLAHIMLARRMNSADYGTYLYAMTVIPIIGIIAQLGFSNASLRFMVLYDEKIPLLKGFIYRSFQLTAIVSLILIGAAIGLTFLAEFVPVEVPEVLKTTIQLALWIMLFFVLTQMAQQHLRALRYITYSQIFEQLLLPFVLISLAAWYFYQNESLPLTTLINTHGATYVVISLITMAILLFILQSKPNWTGKAEYQTNYWLRVSLPLGVGILTITLLSRMDLFLLGFYESPTEIARYGVAIRIAAFLTFGLTALAAIMEPILSELYHNKEIEKITSLVRLIVRLTLAASLLIMPALYLLSDHLLALFGPEYLAARPLLLILGAGQLLNLSAGPILILLNVSGHQNAYMMYLLGVLAVSFVSLIYGISQYGVLGAAISTTAILILMNIGLGFLIYNKTGIRII